MAVARVPSHYLNIPTWEAITNLFPTLSTDPTDAFLSEHDAFVEKAMAFTTTLVTSNVFLRSPSPYRLYLDPAYALLLEHERRPGESFDRAVKCFPFSQLGFFRALAA